MNIRDLGVFLQIDEKKEKEKWKKGEISLVEKGIIMGIMQKYGINPIKIEFPAFSEKNKVMLEFLEGYYFDDLQYYFEKQLQVLMHMNIRMFKALIELLEEHKDIEVKRNEYERVIACIIYIYILDVCLGNIYIYFTV